MLLQPRLGIVLVSHSQTLLTGLLELLSQINHANVPIACAGGTGEVDNPIGTNPMLIVKAIQDIFKKQPNVEAVIVLMDLGSALMSMEAALDFLDDNQKERIWMSDGPIVEGSVVALGAALSSMPITDIYKDISNALLIKTSFLSKYLKK